MKINKWTLGLAAVGVLAVACLGFMTSLLIPSAPPLAEVRTPVDTNPLRSTRSILSYARANPALFRSALGITWCVTPFGASFGGFTQVMSKTSGSRWANPVSAVAIKSSRTRICRY